MCACIACSPATVKLNLISLGLRSSMCDLTLTAETGRAGYRFNFISFFVGNKFPTKYEVKFFFFFEEYNYIDMYQSSEQFPGRNMQALSLFLQRSKEV